MIPRDLNDNNIIMAEITFLFSGCFQQTLPVIPKKKHIDKVHTS